MADPILFELLLNLQQQQSRLRLCGQNFRTNWKLLQDVSREKMERESSEVELCCPLLAEELEEDEQVMQIEDGVEKNKSMFRRYITDRMQAGSSTLRR